MKWNYGSLIFTGVCLTFFWVGSQTFIKIHSRAPFYLNGLKTAKHFKTSFKSIDVSSELQVVEIAKNPNVLNSEGWEWSCVFRAIHAPNLTQPALDKEATVVFSASPYQPRQLQRPFVKKYCFCQELSFLDAMQINKPRW